MSRRYRYESKDGVEKEIMYSTLNSSPLNLGGYFNIKKTLHRKHNMPARIENYDDTVFNDTYIIWSVNSKNHHMTNGDVYFPSTIFYSKDNRCQTEIEFRTKGVLKCRRKPQEKDYYPSIIAGNGDMTWIEKSGLVFTSSLSVAELFDRNSNKRTRKGERKYQRPSHISEHQVVYPNRELEWGLKK